jgi:hypothetical protein
MIWKMILQQLHVTIDGFDKPTLLSERMNQPDSTIAGRRVSVGDFMLDTSRDIMGCWLFATVCLLRCLILRSRSAIFFEQLSGVADELLCAAFLRWVFTRNPFLSHVL